MESSRTSLRSVSSLPWFTPSHRGRGLDARKRYFHGRSGRVDLVVMIASIMDFVANPTASYGVPLFAPLASPLSSMRSAGRASTSLFEWTWLRSFGIRSSPRSLVSPSVVVDLMRSAVLPQHR